VFADSLSITSQRARWKITDGELISLAVAQAATGLCSDRQFLGVVGKLLPGFFPQLPDQTQYNRRLRRLTPYVCSVQLMVAELIAEGRVRLADGTPIGCATFAGCASKCEFAPHAGYGCCPSKSQFYRAMRLVLVAAWKGVPVAMTCAPRVSASRSRCSSSARLIRTAPCSPTRACGGESSSACSSSKTVELVTPNKHRLGDRPPAEVAKARIRLVIESVISNLKRQMRLEDHLAKTLAGRPSASRTDLLVLTLRSSSACSPAARRGRSSPMTGVEPTSAL
jgi:hypothetical protein